MSEPKQEFLRRSQVLSWLEEDHEMTPHQTRLLIEEKIIVGKPLKDWFAETPAAKAAAAKGKNKPSTNGKHHRRKGELGNYYRKSQIKEALKL